MWAARRLSRREGDVLRGCGRAGVLSAAMIDGTSEARRCRPIGSSPRACPACRFASAPPAGALLVVAACGGGSLAGVPEAAARPGLEGTASHGVPQDAGTTLVISTWNDGEYAIAVVDVSGAGDWPMRVLSMVAGEGSIHVPAFRNMDGTTLVLQQEIGRASCRERVWIPV